MLAILIVQFVKGMKDNNVKQIKTIHPGVNPDGWD